MVSSAAWIMRGQGVGDGKHNFYSSNDLYKLLATFPNPISALSNSNMEMSFLVKASFTAAQAHRTEKTLLMLLQMMVSSIHQINVSSFYSLVFH